MMKLKEKREPPSYTIDGKALALEMAPTLDSIVEKKLSERLRDIKNSHSDDELVDCPTCGDHKGHSHKLKSDGKGSLICTGPNCGEKYNLISADPDYSCMNCGTPVKKPLSKELEDSQTCPTCGKDHFKPFDKKKIKR